LQSGIVYEHVPQIQRVSAIADHESSRWWCHTQKPYCSKDDEEWAHTYISWRISTNEWHGYSCPLTRIVERQPESILNAHAKLADVSIPTYPTGKLCNFRWLWRERFTIYGKHILKCHEPLRFAPKF
jgi:hypothetical protein